MLKFLVSCILFLCLMSCEKPTEVIPDQPGLEEQFLNKISNTLEIESLSSSSELKASTAWLQANNLTDHYPIEQATVTKVNGSPIAQITLLALKNRKFDNQLVLHENAGIIEWAGYMNSEFVGVCEGQTNYALNIKDLSKNLLVRMSIDAHLETVSFSDFENKSCDWEATGKAIKSQLENWDWRSVEINLAKVTDPSMGGALLVSQKSLSCNFSDLSSSGSE